MPINNQESDNKEFERLLFISRRQLNEHIKESGFHHCIDGDWLADLDLNRHFRNALLRNDYTAVGVIACHAFEDEFEKHAELIAMKGMS